MSIPRNFICRSAKELLEETKRTLEQLTDSVEQDERCLDKLREENRKLRDEYDKDADIAVLKSEIADLQEDLRRGFRISKAEKAAIEDWMEEHEIEKHSGVHFRGCSGGGYQYIFAPTAIGTYATVRCSCGEEFHFKELG